MSNSWMKFCAKEELDREIKYHKEKLAALEDELLSRVPPKPTREELALVLGGMKIAAIKKYRERWTGLRNGAVASLGECKKELDSWLQRYNLCNVADIFSNACHEYNIMG